MKTILKHATLWLTVAAIGSYAGKSYGQQVTDRTMNAATGEVIDEIRWNLQQAEECCRRNRQQQQQPQRTQSTSQPTIRDCVVFVGVTEGGNRMSSGSGTHINEPGLILTNAHVVGKQRTVQVHFPNGKQYTGTVQLADQQADLAAVRITTTEPAPIATFAAKPPEQGAEIWAVGYPMGAGPHVRQGQAAQFLLQQRPQFMVTTTLVNHGDSGGGVFDHDGNLVGVQESYSDSRHMCNAVSWQEIDSFLKKVQCGPSGCQPGQGSPYYQSPYGQQGSPYYSSPYGQQGGGGNPYAQGPSPRYLPPNTPQSPNQPPSVTPGTPPTTDGYQSIIDDIKRLQGRIDKLGTADPQYPKNVDAATKAIGELRTKIEALEARAPTPGPAGPPGKDGRDGKDADPADLTAIMQRITAIENALKGGKRTHPHSTGTAQVKES